MEIEAEKQTPGQSKWKRHQEKRRKSLTKTVGTDTGLKVYTPKSKGWAEVPLRNNSLLRGIEEKEIKWTYTDSTIKEKDVMEKFVFGLIDLTDYFYLIDDDLFQKIKTGLIKERSPAPRPEKLRKDSI